MTKVYILNKTGHDFSDARRFGELVFLSSGLVPRYSTAQQVRLASPILTSSPDDYIVCGSLTTFFGVCCAMFAARHGVLNLLIFRNSLYIERRIVIS